MDIKEIKNKAFSMPFGFGSYPKGPYRFINREYFIVTYETDMDKLKQVVPEPLEVTEPIVKFEFIRMPDSSGFGTYTESGQVIPVQYNGQPGSFTHAMFLNDGPPILAGREIWGFPKKLANPCITVEKEILVGRLNYESCTIATATMGYKYFELDKDEVLKSLQMPNYLLKIIPHVDGTLRICELVRYHLDNITIKGCWGGPSSLALMPNALAPVADLPVLKVISGVHIVTDLTLPYGEVVHDYLA
jgi:acetoacetate decarboxylase